jgi:hypothetical protein
MATFLKTTIKRSVAENLLRDLTQDTNNYFFFVAKSTEWKDENAPDPYVDSDENERNVGRSTIGYKKMNGADILFVIPRYDWVSGTIYDQYDDSVDLFDEDDPKTFYAFTNQNHIYKCLSNNGGVPSTSQPSSVISTAFTTSDGYIWKYLGTVRESDLPSNLSDYLPINYITDSTNIDTQNQYNTQVQSVQGSISRIDVSVPPGETAGRYTHTLLNSGLTAGLYISKWVGATGDTETLVEITNPASIQLLSSLERKGGDESTINGLQMFTRGYILRVVENDTAIGEINNYGIIVNYGSTGESGRFFTIKNDVKEFRVTVPASGNFPIAEILPFIKIIGDGNDAYVFPNMIGTPLNYTIDGIDVVGGGEFYSHAICKVIPPPYLNTTIPTLTPILSPKGGHGSNILKELNADRVLVVVTLTPEDEEWFLPGGSYRRFGIVKNPTLLSERGSLAGADDVVYRNITLVHTKANDTVTAANNTFGLVSGETKMIIGKESFSASKVVSLQSSNPTTKRVTIKTENVTDQYVTYQDRSQDYILSLGRTGAIFSTGEKLVQYIPLGTTFSVAGSVNEEGVSFAYGIQAEGVVLKVSEIVAGGYTVGVRSTRNYFAVSTTAGITGEISGATGNIVNITPRYGENILTAVVVGGLTFTTDSVFKILDVSAPYFEESSVSRYMGLYGLQINTSVSGVTGALDVSSNPLTPTSFLQKQLVEQGVSGSHTTDYASGVVYYWDYINSSSGTLWLSEVQGKFKNVAANGITGSVLDVYVVSGVSLPDIDPNSGEILYIDNVKAVDRVVGQDEEFRLTIGF